MDYGNSFVGPVVTIVGPLLLTFVGPLVQNYRETSGNYRGTYGTNYRGTSGTNYRGTSGTNYRGASGTNYRGTTCDEFFKLVVEMVLVNALISNTIWWKLSAIVRSKARYRKLLLRLYTLVEPETYSSRGR